MKKILGIFTLIAAIVLTSCVGEQGPPGEDGVSFLGNVFEIEGDFTAQDNYEMYYQFPANFEIYETDIVMVYILWEQYDANDGGTIDVWRALPQSEFFNEGQVLYNYDYSFENVRIFLDGEIDLSTLPPSYTDNQIFRIAVFPADYANNNAVDVHNLNSLMNFMNIAPENIQKGNF